MSRGVEYDILLIIARVLVLNFRRGEPPPLLKSFSDQNMQSFPTQFQAQVQE